MTIKKPTDEEIIQALECHINAEDCVSCGIRGWCDEIILTKLVLDLVNRQKTEIEELKNYVNRCKSGKEYWVKCLLEKPNEALKKFAERMRECCAYNSDLSADAYLSVTTDIYCVLKEMVGEEE